MQELGATPVTIAGPTAICPGESISLTATSDPASTYVWATSGGTLSSTSGQTVDYTMEVPNVYTITVQATNPNGCVSTTSTVVTVNPAPVFSGTPTPATCGSDNGAIALAVSSGAAPFTYAWSNGATTADINNLGAGQYCVTLTDANGCSDSDCFVVTNNNPVEVTLSVTPLTCDSDGSITANTTNGLAPFTYAWSNGATTATIDIQSAGDYCVTVTDANGCTSDECASISEPTAITVTGTVENPVCDLANGSITVTTSAAATYTWSNGASTATIQNLAPGTYTVTATAVSNGCQDITSFTLINAASLSVTLDTMNPACVGAENGSVIADVNYTGSGSLSYTWNNGAITSEINNLAVGQYCVTVTSTEDCQEIACTTLTAPIAINANAIVVAAGCNDNKGSVKLAVTGGTAPYTYKWDNGATTVDILDLEADTYCVTVCDAVGCTFVGCFEVAGGVDFTTSIDQTDVTCNGENDGSATVNTDGGSTPFSYLWSNGATTASINNLIAGDYCVTVTDIFGCSSSSCTEVLEPSLIDINTSATNTTCDADNGSASVSSTSAISSIAWSNGATTNSINDLAAGAYSVTITNSNGCTATDNVNVGSSEDIDVSITTVSSIVCPGEVVALTSTTTPNAGVTYTWTTTGGNLSNTNTSTTNFTMMAAGTYIVSLQVENIDGCIDTDQATIQVLNPNDPACNPNSNTVNIGDFVWFDINNNGLQDPNEQGIPDIDVKLMTAGPDGIFYTADDLTVGVVTTDSLGQYLFLDVSPDEYVIMFCADLPGTEYTSQNSGGNDELDSDADSATGKTDPFMVIAGQEDDLSFDAGIILTPVGGCDNFTDGGEICCDQIICGAGGPVDPLTNITLPSGGSGDIEYLWMSSTIGNVFDMSTYTVIPGAVGPTYDPGSVTQTTFFARCARRVGCTAYVESNVVTLEVKPSPVTTINSLPAFICVGETDNFNAATVGIGTTFTWDLGEGAIPATATGQNLTGVSWSTPGTKTIILTATNANCSVDITRTVTVGSCLNSAPSNRFITLQATPMQETSEVDLKWQTREDMNDYIFLVEHSADGDNYDVIYTMDGVDAFESKNYEYLDKDARPGRNFYRIQHINNNGRTIKSEVVMTMINDLSTDRFIVFPNPTQDYVIFESLKLTEEEGRIMISDIGGMILEEIIIPANTTRQMVDISNYPPGNYVFYIRYDSVRSMPRMINKMEK